MKITDKALHKEIKEFNERQRLNINPEMFILWEYKLTKTQADRKSLFGILKSDNVYLKIESSAVNSNELPPEDFYNSLSLYRESNKKLFSFCSKMIKDFL